MDILTHTVSGLAAGGLVAALSNGSAKVKTAIILTGALGGFLPDIDAVSLWSRFDSTVGNFFSLSNSGKNIYFGKFWYSHHGFMHSIFAGLIFTAMLVFFIFLGRRFFNFSKVVFLTPFSFFCGFIIHLLEDLVTPGSTWGGVRLFFPSDKYVGGWGNIWWWNNYDIFLIVLCVAIINIGLTFMGQCIKNKFIRLLPIGIFIFGSILIIIQINSRNFNFSYSGNTPRYAEYEAKSKEIQQKLLGDKVYSIMKKFDESLKIYF